MIYSTTTWIARLLVVGVTIVAIVACGCSTSRVQSNDGCDDEHDSPNPPIVIRNFLDTDGTERFFVDGVDVGSGQKGFDNLVSYLEKKEAGREINFREIVMPSYSRSIMFPHDNRNIPIWKDLCKRKDFRVSYFGPRE